MIRYSKLDLWRREKIIRESAFDKKKKTPWLKFNPGLALTGVRTTGARASRLPLSFFQIPCNIKVILLDIVNVPQLWSTPAGHEELAGGFKQPSNQRRRNILNNNHAIYSLSTPTSCLLTLLYWVCVIVFFKDLSLWKLLAHFLQKYIFVKKSNFTVI